MNLTIQFKSQSLCLGINLIHIFKDSKLMVSTVIHVSVALIIGCALLPSRNFSYKSLGIVGLSVALLDADAFLFFIADGLHRTVFHNIVFPTIILFLILTDTLYRENSFLSDYIRKDVLVPLSVVCYIAVLCAGIGLDYSDNGANLLWPLHDQFYSLSDKFVISSESGIVQTFINSPSKIVAENPERTVGTTSFTTPASQASESSNPIEFGIVYSGWGLIMIITSLITVAVRSLFERFEFDS
jgi:inner membrane protein